MKRTAKLEVWLPATFWYDHDERALPSGEFIRQAGQRVLVRVTDAELAEIRNRQAKKRATMTNPLYPRMTAIVGNHPDNICQLPHRMGERLYYPKVIVHGTTGHPYDDRFTVNCGGNHCRQEGEEGLESFDRLALLFAAAPDLLAALEECIIACDFEARGHGGIAKRAEAAIAKAKGEQSCS